MESIGECWCVDQYGYELPRTRTSSSNKPNCTLLAWLTPCQIQRRQAMGNDGTPVVGLFVPECKPSGAYEPVQCHTDPVSTEKTCWCVNSHGIEVEDSRRRPGIRPFCGEKSLCEEIRKESNAKNLTDKPLFQCQKNGRFSPVQCSHGMCWCVNEYGNEFYDTVTMEPRNCSGLGLTQCQVLHNKAIAQGSSLISRCEVDGSYSPMQCNVGQCWCVDRYNREVLGTRRTGMADCRSKEDNEICKMPFVRGPCEAMLRRWYFNSATNACSVFLYGGCAGNENKFVSYQECQQQCRGTPLTKCQQEKLEFRFDLSTHNPDCNDHDGSYKPLQCHLVTKECWCVNSDGIKLEGYRSTNGTNPICPNNNGKSIEIQGLK
ncbi:thyroglobulin-like [Actinia tenebrosa]|uniref:Thyroglobulin-like n=1 Tax=Actinia tenebrosa TaxID=6105 RepID=A0A6P8ICG6_ACTTE|nr:thyroglobulin-like [Actinia tenebrosa]